MLDVLPVSEKVRVVITRWVPGEWCRVLVHDGAGNDVGAWAAFQHEVYVQPWTDAVRVVDGQMEVRVVQDWLPTDEPVQQRPQYWSWVLEALHFPRLPWNEVDQLLEVVVA